MATIKLRRGLESDLQYITTQEGEILVTEDSQKILIGSIGNTVFQPIGTTFYNHCHNYLISGTIQSGSDNYINPFFVALGNEQSASIIGYVGTLQTGSCVINIKQNNNNVVSGINISDSVNSGSCDISLSNYDMLNIEVVSSVSASNLSFGIIVENICQ